MISIVPITNNLIPQLNVFCNECALLGYKNNSSIESMKLKWCKSNGEFFCALKDEKIIAVAGCHKFIQIERWYSNPWRILFRGCELPGNDNFKGLGKGDWNSITQREFIPIFIEYCKSENLFLTTNIEADKNSKMHRNHRLMTLLSKQKILDHVNDITIYNVYQSVWKLNIREYNRRRNLLKENYVH